MQSQNRLLWIGLIIAIAFGLALEALKSTRGLSGSASWRPKFFGMQELEDSTDVDGVGTHRRSAKSADLAQRARSRLLRGRVAGLSGLEAATSPSVAQVVAPGPTLSNLAAPTQINSDPKKKVEDAKKKKKKKKKRTKPGDATDFENQSPAADTSASNDKPVSNSGGFRSAIAGDSSSQARTFLGGVSALNENPQTLEEWKTFILREPSYERTMKLVEAQQKHAIDSDIFHEVVSEMLTDSREKMHEYAILALGSSPGLESFLLLQAAAQAQSEDSPLRLQARNYLKAYSKLENLRYLGSVIASETESGIAFEALRLIQMAVSTYKAKPVHTPSRPGTLAIVARQFTPLVSILTRAAATSKDKSVRQEASQTLNDVNSLIGTVSGPAV